MKVDRFPEFQTSGLTQHLEWLRQLSGSVAKVVTFGCMSSEPFVLLCILGASEIKIVERNAQNLEGPMGPIEELGFLSRKYPAIYKPKSVEFIIADMSTPISNLPSDYFDLAFCEDVLYNMESDRAVLQSAVSQMTRVVRPGGWVIAVEPKFGASFEFADSWLGQIPVRTSEPKDMSQIFDALGLMPTLFKDTPRWAYCFVKPRGQ